MRAHAEGAELASDEADVGEIDIARDDVADNVTHQPTPDFVGRDGHAEQIVAGGAGQQNCFVTAKDAAVQRA